MFSYMLLLPSLFYYHSYADASGAGKDVYEYVSSSDRTMFWISFKYWIAFFPSLWWHSLLFHPSLSLLCLFFFEYMLIGLWLTTFYLFNFFISVTPLMMSFCIKLRLFETISNFTAATYGLVTFNFLYRLSLLENLRKQSELMEFLHLISLWELSKIIINM